jgi:hypothetical protein
MAALEISLVAMDRPIRWVCLWVALATSAGSAGCASPLQAIRLGRKPVLLGPIGSGAASTQPATRPVPGYDDSAWQALLLKHVAPGWNATPDPRTGEFDSPPYPELVEYREILQHPEDLNDCLAVLERTGPANTPREFASPAHQLAYYINAYNACAVRAALADYPAETAYAPIKPAFEMDWYFRVDGQRLNLRDLRQKVWAAAAGDVRVLFTLCEAALGSAPLAPHPYKAGDLREELDAQVKMCLAMPQFVMISHEHEQLQLWWRIIRSNEVLISWYEKLYGSPPGSLLNVVMEMAPAHERKSLNKAVGYKIVEVPFDRRLNDLLVRASAATPRHD